MHVLDLFSGIGGFSLGLERAGMRTVAFCEINPYCRAVLRKHWPEVPCFEDIRGLDADRLAGLGRIDLICGGFPCQPWSVAGKRKGKNDDRDLWHEMFRVITQVRPAWIIGENVTGLVGLALDGVLTDLEGIGYSARPFVIPAAAIGAPHRRNRLWIVATNSNSHARRRIESERRADQRNTDASGHGPEGNVRAMAHANGDSVWHDQQWEARRWEHVQNRGHAEFRNIGEDRSADVADTSGARLSIPEPEKLQRAMRREERRATSECGWWAAEPPVGRVAHGVSNRVDRLRALGNAVVPQIPEIIGRAIMSIESGRRGR